MALKETELRASFPDEIATKVNPPIGDSNDRIDRFEWEQRVKVYDTQHLDTETGTVQRVALNNFMPDGTDQDYPFARNHAETLAKNLNYFVEKAMRNRGR